MLSGLLQHTLVPKLQNRLFASDSQNDRQYMTVEGCQQQVQALRELELHPVTGINLTIILYTEWECCLGPYTQSAATEIQQTTYYMDKSLHPT